MPLRPNLALLRKHLDRRVDQVDDVLVANVRRVGAAVAIDAKGAGAVSNELVGLAAEADGPGTAVCGLIG
jgi:hypothetical protein